MLLRLGGLFFIASAIFWLWAIFDSLTCDGQRVRNLPRWAWLVVILVFLELGALTWALFGRPRQAGALATRGSRPAARRGPLGPDDDPDFLRNLPKF